jgi:hypothetical protein
MRMWRKSIKGYWGKTPNFGRFLPSLFYLASEELDVLLRICFFSSALTCYSLDYKLAKT